VRVLIVEDQVRLAAALKRGFAKAGMAADVAGCGEDALWMAASAAYDAVILDVVLPGLDGFQTCARLREEGVWTPILMLTARGGVEDRVAGLDCGADDYLVKPFSLEELYARLRAVVRRSQGRVSPVLTHRDVTIDPARRLVTQAGAQVVLSAHEYRTLLALLERKGWVLTRNQLEDAVYGNSSTIESNTIAVYIHQLRRKFGNDFIETVPGFGYRIGGAHP
jgi:two-component system, OmpR family, response regulator